MRLCAREELVPTAKYARSFTLPARVDADRTTATLANGVLTVRMEKAADAKPRRIAIGA